MITDKSILHDISEEQALQLDDFLKILTEVSLEVESESDEWCYKVIQKYAPENIRKLQYYVDITPVGKVFLQSGGFTKAKSKVDKKSNEQEKLLQLQITDLETKINTLNTEQLDFFRTSSQRNTLQSVFIIISIIMGLISMLSIFGGLFS